MKYNRFIALMLVFVTLFSLISCKRNNQNNDHNDGHGHNTNIENQQSNNQQQQQGGEGNVTFYYSVNSDKFHVADCYHLYSIVDKFLKTSTSVSELVADGYSPCKDCILVEEKSDEDDTNKITKEEATFVIGTGNNKLHTLDCHNVRSIQEKHLEYTNLTIEELMEIDKYAPCKDCLPNEAKIYYENHPEKDTNNKN